MGEGGRRARRAGRGHAGPSSSMPSCRRRPSVAPNGRLPRTLAAPRRTADAGGQAGAAGGLLHRRALRGVPARAREPRSRASGRWASPASSACHGPPELRLGRRRNCGFPCCSIPVSRSVRRRYPDGTADRSARFSGAGAARLGAVPAAPPSRPSPSSRRRDRSMREARERCLGLRARQVRERSRPAARPGAGPAGAAAGRPKRCCGPCR